MNGNKVFFDSAAFFALADKDDQYHRKAQDYLRTAAQRRIAFITSNWVINESAMLIARSVSKSAALRFLDTVSANPSIEIIRVEAAAEQESLEMFRKYKDQDFSITDCSSFVLMRNSECNRCFTFDAHFRTMRFIIEP